MVPGDYAYIQKNCDGNLKKAIWLLDTKRLNSSTLITLDEVFETVVDLIMDAPKSKNMVKIFDTEIRTHIYNILITNIKGSEIIISLLDLLIKRIDDDEINSRIIGYASDAEYNLIHGRREIIHIDYFINGVMMELINRPTSKPGKTLKPIKQVTVIKQVKSVKVVKPIIKAGSKTSFKKEVVKPVTKSGSKSSKSA